MINSFLVYDNDDRLAIAYSNPSISFYKLTNNTFVFKVETKEYYVKVDEDFKIQMDTPVCLIIKGDINTNSYKLDFNKKSLIDSNDFIQVENNDIR